MAEDLMKVAEQYDAAGRFMAHGFVDEFNKLAHNLGLEKIGMGMRYGTGKGAKKCPGCKMAMSKCKCPR